MRKSVGIVTYDVEGLVSALQSLIGKQTWIAESISRNREIGHDRHFATISYFVMIPKSVSWSISGANFHIDGNEGFSYSLSSERIVRFSSDEAGRITIIEQFESKTERKTTLWTKPVSTDE